MSKKGEWTSGAIFGSVIGMIVFFGLMLGFDTVPASHIGVMVEWGNIKGTMFPGTRWTGLFTDVYSYDLRTRQTVVKLEGADSAPDKGGQAVYGIINVNYRLKQDPDIAVRLFKNIGEDSRIVNVLNIIPIIKEGFKQATVKYTSMEILENRQQVKEAAIENIKNNFPKDYFEIQDIVISNIDFSPEFNAAIEAKKIAEQNAIKEENQLQVVIFQQKQEIEKSKAAAMQMQLQKSELTDLLIQQQWIGKWDGKLPQYMLVSQEQANYLLQLPVQS
jgi:regulator of protease activity HflC (stomatin/prohibitin superfamily)